MKTNDQSTVLSGKSLINLITLNYYCDIFTHSEIKIKKLRVDIKKNNFIPEKNCKVITKYNYSYM